MTMVNSDAVDEDDNADKLSTLAIQEATGTPLLLPSDEAAVEREPGEDEEDDSSLESGGIPIKKPMVKQAKHANTHKGTARDANTARIIQRQRN